jgi:hypothetical protein
MKDDAAEVMASEGGATNACDTVVARSSDSDSLVLASGTASEASTKIDDGEETASESGRERDR